MTDRQDRATTRRRRATVGALLASATAAALVVPGAGAAAPTDIELISVGEGGAQRSGQSSEPSVSGDGRFVAYSAWSSELQGEVDEDVDVFVHDRVSGTTELVSVGTSSPSASGNATNPAMADGGGAVAFESVAADLVADDTNGVSDVFVRHLATDETELVSLDVTGGPADGPSSFPSISAGGRFVAFQSSATDLVAGDTNGHADVFVRDLQTDVTTLVSVGTAGEPAKNVSESPHISADGRFVAFTSMASNLSTGPPNILISDVFVRDLEQGVTTQITFDADGTATDQPSRVADISADGRYVVLVSQGALVAGLHGGIQQTYRHDRMTATTEMVSVTPTGQPGDDQSTMATVSGDGRYVAFTTEAASLYVCPRTPSASDIVVVRDMVAKRSALASVLPTAGEAHGRLPDLSADGQTLTFDSRSALIPGHTGDELDVWARGLPDLDVLFSDVLDHHPFRCDIGWLVEEGIAAGFDDGTFRSASPVSRQAMAAFLYRYAGSPDVDPPAEPTFPDVPLDHPFSHEIEWLADTGVTNGYPDGTFRPTAIITRQSMAALFHRLAGEPAVELPTTPTFPDAPLDHTFFAEIEWLTAAGIAEGFDDETFRPASPVSRQATAAFLHRYDQVVP